MQYSKHREIYAKNKFNVSNCFYSFIFQGGGGHGGGNGGGYGGGHGGGGHGGGAPSKIIHVNIFSHVFISLFVIGKRSSCEI